MPQVKVIQLNQHVRWRTGEIITVKVASQDDDAYLCETIETYPEDLKERHVEELAAVKDAHAQELASERADHAEQIQAVRLGLTGAPPPRQ